MDGVAILNAPLQVQLGMHHLVLPCQETSAPELVSLA